VRRHCLFVCCFVFLLACVCASVCAPMYVHCCSVSSMIGSEFVFRAYLIFLPNSAYLRSLGFLFENASHAGPAQPPRRRQAAVPRTADTDSRRLFIVVVVLIVRYEDNCIVAHQLIADAQIIVVRFQLKNINNIGLSVSHVFTKFPGNCKNYCLRTLFLMYIILCHCLPRPRRPQCR
jgi:hypothetical protein